MVLSDAAVLLGFCRLLRWFQSIVTDNAAYRSIAVAEAAFKGKTAVPLKSGLALYGREKEVDQRLFSVCALEWSDMLNQRHEGPGRRRIEAKLHATEVHTVGGKRCGVEAGGEGSGRCAEL